MNGLRSSSSSSSGYLKCSVFRFLCSSIFLLNFTANANGFNPLIQLPTNDVYRNISSGLRLRTVRLNINDFGAKGDGFTDDTKCLQDIWKAACSLSSPAKIVIPAGHFYLFGPIIFVGPCRSKVTLKVAGSVYASKDPRAWEGLDIHKWLYFHEVDNLKIEGWRGMIDGQGPEWWASSCRNSDANVLFTSSIPCTHAPTAITFHKCNNLKLRNLNLINGPQTRVAFAHCNRVSASRITIVQLSDSPNTKGIHITASTNVELKDTNVIVTGDDCISIGSNSSRIHIKNIFCATGHGISIGSLGKHDSYDAVQDVIVSGAVLCNTTNGVRIKTCQGGRGSIRNVTFENVWMRNVSNPIVIDQYYCESLMTCPNQTSSISIDTISFRGIRGTSATEEAIKFACSDSYPCRRLYLENIGLVTSSGTAKSFCWEAYGTNSGMVYPRSCVTSGDIIIHHQVKYNSTWWNKGLVKSV